MGAYAKSMWKTLRRLKKSCTVVHDIMKALMNLPYMDAVSSVLNCVVVANFHIYSKSKFGAGRAVVLR